MNMMNGILSAEGNDEKKVSDFQSLTNEKSGAFLELEQLFDWCLKNDYLF